VSVVAQKSEWCGENGCVEGFISFTHKGRSVVKPCPCRGKREMMRLLAQLPKTHSWARLGTLQPSESDRVHLSPKRQLLVLEQLRANPEQSYLFLGPTGIGKTTWLAALAAHAIETQMRDVWVLTLGDYLRSAQKAMFETDYVPPLALDKIRQLVKQRRRVRVFLDEFDKAKATEFAQNAAHELVDGLYRLSPGGMVQLVVASNLTRDEFAETWGAQVLRRIEEMCGDGCLIDLHEETV